MSLDGGNDSRRGHSPASEANVWRSDDSSRSTSQSVYVVGPSTSSTSATANGSRCLTNVVSLVVAMEACPRVASAAFRLPVASRTRCPACSDCGPSSLREVGPAARDETGPLLAAVPPVVGAMPAHRSFRETVELHLSRPSASRMARRWDRGRAGARRRGPQRRRVGRACRCRLVAARICTRHSPGHAIDGKAGTLRPEGGKVPRLSASLVDLAADSCRRAAPFKGRHGEPRIRIEHLIDMPDD